MLRQGIIWPKILKCFPKLNFILMLLDLCKVVAATIIKGLPLSATAPIHEHMLYNALHLYVHLSRLGPTEVW